MPKLHKINAEILETVSQQLNNAKMEYNAMVDAIKDMQDVGLDVHDLLIDYHTEISQTCTHCCEDVQHLIKYLHECNK